jgi:ketosteroid isomerase-like protein
MRWLSLRAVALLLFSLVVLYSPFAPAQAPPSDTKAADSKAALMKADRDFLAAVKARKTDGFMEFMTEETRILSSGKPYTGMQAIRAAVAEDYKDPDFSVTWDPETAVLLESGEMGYTSGHFVVSGTGPDKKPYKSGGQYITIWKKQKDGSWKVL